MGVIQEGINRGLGLTALGLQQDKNLQEKVQHNIDVEKAQKLTAFADKLETEAQDYSTVNNTLMEGNDGKMSSLEKEGLNPVNEKKEEYYKTNNSYLNRTQSTVNNIRNKAIDLDPGFQTLGAMVSSNENFAGYHERLDKSIQKYRDKGRMRNANQQSLDNTEIRIDQKNTTLKWMEKLKNKQKPDSILGGKK